MRTAMRAAVTPASICRFGKGVDLRAPVALETIIIVAAAFIFILPCICCPPPRAGRLDEMTTARCAAPSFLLLAHDSATLLLCILIVHLT